jgi:iron(III) transport system ATP-binding protein
VRQNLRQEIRSLQQRLGVTTIMVTHDQEEAMSVSDRVVVMSRGRIEQIGTPSEVYDRPTSPFVASFIGHSSHFPATVDSPGGMIVASGHRLAADAARPLLYGARVTVFIRPEHIRLERPEAATPGALSVRVTGIEFLGSVCRIALEAGALRLLAALSPDAFAALGAEPGGALAATLPPDRLMVFPEDV